MKFIFCFILSLSYMATLCGQARIQQKIEISYILTANDSVTNYRKESTYDTAGNIIQKKYEYFSSRGNEVVYKEEKSSYDASTKVLTEWITTFPNSDNSKSKKLTTKFLDYSQNKHIWRKLYDNFQDLYKEDTLSYNENQQLTKKCVYDYRGNTFLACDNYIYNKKNLKSQWITYNKWTTINGRSKVVQRKTKVRHYRYRYYANGKLKSVRGKYYKSFLCRKIKYDKNGLLYSDITRTRKKSSRSKKIAKNKKKDSANSQKKKEDQKKKKYESYIYKTIWQKKYKNGKEIEELKLADGQERFRLETSYQDSVVSTSKKYLKKILTETLFFTYDKDLNLVSKKRELYNTNGKLRFAAISTYNSNKQVTKEEQFILNKKYATSTRTFDIYGNIIKQILSRPNNSNTEEKMYIYTYY